MTFLTSTPLQLLDKYCTFYSTATLQVKICAYKSYDELIKYDTLSQSNVLRNISRKIPNLL